MTVEISAERDQTQRHGMDGGLAAGLEDCRAYQAAGQSGRKDHPIERVHLVVEKVEGLEEAGRAAEEDTVPWNLVVSAVSADGHGHSRAIVRRKERAAPGKVDAALSSVDRAPNVALDPGDELPGARRSASVGTARA